MKTAGGVVVEEEEAATFMYAVKDKDKHSIERRKGINMRCESLCDVDEVCYQYQSIKVQND